MEREQVVRTRYSEDQQAVSEAFGDLFARESTPESVRAAEAGGGFDRGLWDTLAATGAMGMALPEEVGGGGASLADLAVVVYEWGRRIAPVPLVEHAVAGRLLASSADPGAIEVVAGAAAGEIVATIALQPPLPDGTARLVPAGAVADAVAACRDGALVLARREPPGASRPNTAGLPLADRDLSEAVAVSSGPMAEDVWDRALAEWKALMAVAHAGLGREVLDMGVAYVKQRHQFGVPVGSFQAVQHGLADAATRTEGARLLAFRAVSALEAEQRDAPRLAAMALLFSAESARFAADRVLQYHGGYGYSAEYDVQLYYRRAASWLLQLGEPATQIAFLADTELGPKEPRG